MDNEQEQGRIYGCLLGLRLLSRRYEFRSQDEAEAVEEIAQAAVPLLLQVVQVLLCHICHSGLAIITPTS